MRPWAFFFYEWDSLYVNMVCTMNEWMIWASLVAVLERTTALLLSWSHDQWWWVEVFIRVLFVQLCLDTKLQIFRVSTPPLCLHATSLTHLHTKETILHTHDFLNIFWQQPNLQNMLVHTKIPHPEHNTSQKLPHTRKISQWNKEMQSM